MRQGGAGAAVVVAGWLAAGVAAARDPAAVERIGQTSGERYARVAIYLSRAAPYKAFVLPAAEGRPTRLVIDFQGAHLTPRSQRPLISSGGLLQRVRAGQFKPEVARVVLELAALGDYRLIPLDHPFRLLVDVRGAAGAPAKAQPPPPVVVLDPGHGGSDPGATGVRGLREKDVALAIVRELARFLEASGVKVVLTRAGDTYVPLEKRTAIANAAGADLFVSVHTNASENRRLHGVETYYLNNTDNRATIRLAAIENGLAGLLPKSARAGQDLQYILSDLVQTGKVEDSVVLASQVQQSLVGHLRARYRGVRDLGVKQGPFYVLVGAYMPCILVETSFITHPLEGGRLSDPDYLAAVAEGLGVGLTRYLRSMRMARTL